MRNYCILCLLFLLAVTEICHAQNYLSLRSNGRAQQQYIPGKEISLTWQNGIYNSRITGYIDSIGNDFIFVNGARIYLQDIKKVHVLRSSFNYRNGGINLMLGGALLATLLYTNDREAHENRPFYIASGVLFAGGMAMFSRAQKTYILNDKNKLFVVNPK